MANGEYVIKTKLDTTGLESGFNKAEQLSENYFVDQQGKLRDAQGKFVEMGKAAQLAAQQGAQGFGKLGDEVKGSSEEAKEGVRGLSEEILRASKIKAGEFGLKRAALEFKAGISSVEQYRKELEYTERETNDLLKTSDRLSDEYVHLTARLAATKNELKLLDNQSDKTEKGMGRLKTAAIGFGAGLAGYFSGQAIGNAVRNILAVADASSQVAETILLSSQKTGIGIETYQELAFAAGQLGVETTLLDKGLTTLNIKIGDAAKGNKAAVAAFKAVGVSLKDDVTGNLKTTDEVFVDVLDKLSKIPDAGARAAAAQDLFGGSSRNLLPILSEGAEGFNDLRKQARDLGLILTAEGVMSLEAYGDEVATVKKQFETAKTEVIAGFLPVLRNGVFPLLQNTIIPLFQNVGTYLNTMTTRFGESGEAGKTFRGDIAGAITPLLRLGDVVIGAGQGFQGFANYVFGATAGVGAAIGNLSVQLAEFGEVLNAISQYQRGDFLGAFETLQGVDLSKVTFDFGAVQDEFVSASSGYFASAEKNILAGNERLTRAFTQEDYGILGALEDTAQGMQTTGDAAGALGDDLEEVVTPLEDIGNAAQTSGEKTSAWATALGEAAKRGLVGFTTASDQLETKLEELQGKLSLTNPDDTEAFNGLVSQIQTVESTLEALRKKAEDTQKAIAGVLQSQGAPSAVGIGAGAQKAPTPLNVGIAESSKNSARNAENDARQIALDTANALNTTIPQAIKDTLFGSTEFSSIIGGLNGRSATEQGKQNAATNKQEVQDFSSTIAGYNTQADAANDKAAAQQAATEAVQDFSSDLQDLFGNGLAQEVEYYARKRAEEAEALAESKRKIQDFSSTLSGFNSRADRANDEAAAQRDANAAVQDFSSDLYHLGEVADIVSDAQSRMAEAAQKAALGFERSANARTFAGFVAEQKLGSSQQQQQLTESLLLRGLPNAGAGLNNEEVLKGLRGQGLDDSIINEGVTVLIDGIETGLVDAVDIQKKGADDFASTVIQAAGQAGQLLVGVLSGKTSAGGFLAGAGSIAGAFVPGPVGTAISVGSSLLGGLVDFFTGGSGDEEEKRRREKEQSRSVPAISIKVEVNQHNEFDANLTDAKVQSALYQQTRQIVGEVLEQTGVMQIVKESRETK